MGSNRVPPQILHLRCAVAITDERLDGDLTGITSVVIRRASPALANPVVDEVFCSLCVFQECVCLSDDVSVGYFWRRTLRQG